MHRYQTFRRSDGHTVKLPMDRGEGQHWNRAPGNLLSQPRQISIEGSKDELIRITLDKAIPTIPEAEETSYIKTDFAVMVAVCCRNNLAGQARFYSGSGIFPASSDIDALDGNMPTPGIGNCRLPRPPTPLPMLPWSEFHRYRRRLLCNRRTGCDRTRRLLFHV